jgi:murein DD-endopeptidase MepM/ murein hydrolase activator NlpD
VALLTASAILVSPRAGAHDLHRRLEEISDQIQRQQALIARAEGQEKTLLARIAASDARRAELDAKVAALSARLDVAEGRLAEVQADLDAAERELSRLEHRLTLTNARLVAQINTLDRRASLTYQYGPGGYLSALLGADTFGDLIDRTEFLGFALTADSLLVDDIRQTKAEIEAQETAVARQRDAIAVKRDAVQAEVDRIAELKAEQQVLLDAVEHELAVRQGALADIRDSKTEWEDAVKELQRESNRIEALLQGTASAGTGRYNGELFFPTNGAIGSGFGWRVHPIYGTRRFHSGVDIGGACGQPIWAAEDGVVVSAGYNGGYGNATVIDHGNGLATLYAHQSLIQVIFGQKVSRAQQIGLVGTTGLSTGCHLHFEVRINGTPVDPVPYLT